MFKRWKKTSANHWFARKGEYKAWIYNYDCTGNNKGFEVIVQRITASKVFSCSNFDLMRFGDTKSAKKAAEEFAKILSAI